MKTLIFLIITLLLQGCEPTKTHEETVTIEPAYFKTLANKQASDGLCRGGTRLETPGPKQIIVGFFHRFNNDDGCFLNQIYQGLLRFQIDAAPFYKRLIKTATLNLDIMSHIAVPGRDSCIDKISVSDVDWWSSGTFSTLIPLYQLSKLRIVPPSTQINIDVTSEVQRWANNTEDNNGFVLIGQRPEFSDFSNTGMLTNESCRTLYGNINLKVTFFQFDKPAHRPLINVNSIRTQTTTDLTIKGTDFTPQSTVSLFVDDIPGRMGSFPIGNVNTDTKGAFSYFHRSLCTGPTSGVTIRALDQSSGNNARSNAVFCY